MGIMGVIETLTGNLTYLVLLILLIVYIPLFFYVKNNPKMAERGIVTYGPFIMQKTRRGIELLDKLARYKRFWRVFGAISKAMAFFLMALIIFILVIDLLLLPSMMDQGGIGIEYALAIPGLNPLLPLVYGVIGLIVAVVIHEIAHGIQTRANDMKVESVGILYAVVPMGAFVEPNEEQIKKCGRKARSSMYAAGIAINLTAAIVLFLVLSFGLMGSMSSDFGYRAAVVNVVADSPAADTDIVYSSIIWGIQTDILKPHDPETFVAMNYDALMGHDVTPADKYIIRFATESNEMNTALIRLGVFITGVAAGSPAANAHTVGDPSDIVGIPKNSFLISIKGSAVTSMDEFVRIMDDLVAPGETVEVVYREYLGGGDVGDDVHVEVRLGERNGDAFLGVNYTFSGFSLTTPDAVLGSTKNPFSEAESISDVTYAALSYIGMPWRGYSPLPQEVQWWYHSSFLSDDALWIIMQTVFWIFWLNLVLGVTNALPAVPFDGGYLLMDGVGYIVDRTRKDDTPEQREKLTAKITSIVSYATLFILLLVMVAILF
ncbi:MAG: site-2 protease family protein [Methanomassiliicoccaceae archaeon]|jgi:membrane-associated protease RseP (regulator of RpoE activity)|nr:site-2 protease family protein [Methanomassiliicoccaceae archaeon]